MAANAAKGKSTLALLVALTAPLALGACVAVETTAEIAPDAAASRQIRAPRGREPRPGQRRHRLGRRRAAGDRRAISPEGSTRAARARDIAVVDAAKARYLVRGYLSASPTEDGAEIEYVWDVFTADKQRVQRLNDVIEVKGAGDDPWALAGEAA